MNVKQEHAVSPNNGNGNGLSNGNGDGNGNGEATAPPVSGLVEPWLRAHQMVDGPSQMFASWPTKSLRSTPGAFEGIRTLIAGMA